MFDGDITTAEREAQDRQALADSLARLFQRFDPLLAEGASLTPDQDRELRAMAAIFDLEAQGSSADVWRALRPVLARQTTGAAAPAMELDAESLTLMVVEDDAETAADLVDALDAAGHRVVGPFHDADMAMAAAAGHAIDVALLDINLSGPTTGIALARSLKANWGTRVLFLSGDVSAAARHAELAEALVLKPYRMRDVLAAVRSAVAAG